MIDRYSATWAVVQARAEVAVGRAMDDLVTQRDPILAAEMRGRIAALSEIIALGAPPEEVEPEREPSRDLSGY